MDKKLLPLVSRVRILQDRLLGKLLTLGFDPNVDAQLDTLTLEIVKTFEIEGETLNDELVCSSVARHLCIVNTSLINLLEDDKRLNEE